MTSDVFTLFKSEFPKSANQGIELSTVVLVEIKLYSSSTISTGTPVTSINKTDRHDITEILLKVALNTITPLNISYVI
jgi:hypothetical protein